MARRWAISVTIVTMLFHVTLGCCWHHAHRCACDSAAPLTPGDSAAAPSRSEIPLTASLPVHHRHAVFHRCLDDGPSAPHGDPLPVPCDEQHCQFVLEAAVKPVNGPDLAVRDHCPSLTALQTCRLRRMVRLPTLHPFLCDLSSSSRVQAVTQVWLL